MYLIRLNDKQILEIELDLISLLRTETDKIQQTKRFKITS